MHCSATAAYEAVTRCVEHMCKNRLEHASDNTRLNDMGCMTRFTVSMAQVVTHYI